MKRLFTLLLLSFAALSCEMTDENIDDLLDKRDWVVFAEGTELSVDVPSTQTVLNYNFESTLDWEVKTDAEWLEVDPTSGKAGKDIKIQIKVLHNKDKEARTGYADLTLSNDESYRITINQAGEVDENDDIVVDIPNNQIWYTSTDGGIVEPYSGEYNEYADAFTTFGVNIVSNTYADGKGVIEFDGDITTIGYLALALRSNLESVTIPYSVTTIGYWAFYGSSSLTSITIPDSVTEIGAAAFSGCSSLTSVTIPDSVTSIGEGAFFGCSSLQEFNGKFASEDGRCLIIDGVLNSFAPGGLVEYTIPDSVTAIGESAFDNCSNLTSVTIPDSVTTIGYGAFVFCNTITTLPFPKSVTTIGDYAFYGCSSLTSVTIPDSVTSIGSSAFCFCTSFTSITIPDSVTEIGNAAFSDCSSLQEFNGKFASEDGRCLIIDGTLNSFAPARLTEYDIPDSVTSIGNAAFRDCSRLTSITIPDSVTTIGYWAFGSCSSLTSVTIPDSVTSIGDYAFDDCSGLTSVYCKATTTPAGGTYMFSDNASGRKIYVPMGSVEAYKSAYGWSDYADAIVGYNF